MFHGSLAFWDCLSGLVCRGVGSVAADKLLASLKGELLIARLPGFRGVIDWLVCSQDDCRQTRLFLLR